MSAGGNAETTPALALQDLLTQLEDLESQRKKGLSPDTDVLDAATTHIYVALGACLRDLHPLSTLLNALTVVGHAAHQQTANHEGALRLVITTIRSALRVLQQRGEASP